MEEINQEQEKKRKKLFLILLLLLLLSVGGYLVYRHFNQPDIPVTVVSGEFLPDGKDAKEISAQELKKMAQKKVDASQFNMVIAPDAHVVKGHNKMLVLGH